MKILFSRIVPQDTGTWLFLLPSGAPLRGERAITEQWPIPLQKLRRLNGSREDKLPSHCLHVTSDGRTVQLLLADYAPKMKETWREIGGRLAKDMMTLGTGSVALMTALKEDDVADLTEGMALRGYRFDKYRKISGKNEPQMPDVTVVSAKAAALEKAWGSRQHIADGVSLARDWINEPGNALYPESFARAIHELKPLGISIEILREEKLRRIGAGALLAVGQGSAHRPCMVVMEWRGPGAGKNSKPIALVGKGVTFDTGGISIKPQQYMLGMKGDMGGAAVCAATMAILARQKAKCHVVAVLPLVENMPSGGSFRPGDVVRSLSGKTIEVIDTDAEGRLILADALSYAVRQFKPRAIIDFATLTGSIIAALGRGYAGLFCSDDTLAEKLQSAGAATGERLWRMPLDDFYLGNLESDIADIRQIAADVERADACHAAAFLQQFTGDIPWAHIDIAGKEIAEKGYVLGPSGGTGFGVRMLAHFLMEEKGHAGPRTNRPGAKRATAKR